jgi:F-type H+-transporting ATPase subunit gamma
MPSLKDLKNRIASVTSTRKITKAMQMVAAAKLRRAQDAAESARPYADRMSAVMSNLVSGVGDSESAPRLLAGSGRSNIHLLILASSERGLCGGFNSSIVRLARSHIADLQNSGKTVKIITVGKKGREQIKRDFADLIINHVDLSEVKRISYGNAKSIADDVLARFSVEEFDICTIFYNEFKSVISQVPTALQLIPAALKETANIDDAFYEYEPDETEILAEFLPRAMSTQIFTALLENGASEQGARMSAMDSATRNAGDMIDKLTIEYNRSRQAVITNELIEIISGAEAL